MSFGYRDRDWIDPPEEPTFRATHSDCTHFNECPGKCGNGWCDDIGEFVDGTEVITVGDDCETFEGNASFDPNWEEEARGDELYDAYRDRLFEEEMEARA